MFAEELGISPYRITSAGDYRRRVAGLIDAGRAFGIIDRDGEVVFKADIGAVSPHTCQVQGVWVRPDQRGQGIGGAALAEVLREALTLAPTVSLYVNDFNQPARRMYERLGMRQVATLSTILFLPPPCELTFLRLVRPGATCAGRSPAGAGAPAGGWAVRPLPAICQYGFGSFW
jgi:uncharacterized protein